MLTFLERLHRSRLLRRDGADAHTVRLAAFARVRGELGALSAGRAELYYRRRGRLGRVDPEADRLGRVERLRARWPDADVDLTAVSPYTSRR